MGGVLQIMIMTMVNRIVVMSMTSMTTTPTKRKKPWMIRQFRDISEQKYV